jgi:hypothetical protein
MRQVLILEIAPHGNASEWAKSRGISPQYVSEVLRGKKDAGEKILRAIGLRRIVGYEELNETNR